MAKTIAVFNIKGGVGKTTSAVNLAYLFAKSGKKTLLWDMDHQAAAGYFLNKDASLKGGLNSLVKDMSNTPAKRQIADKIVETDYENLSLLPSDMSLRHLDIKAAESRTSKKFIDKMIAPLKEEFDVIIIDCAPGLTAANESLLFAIDLVLVPIIPTVLSVRTLEQLKEHIAKLPDAPKVRAFFTMMDSRKNMHKAIYEELCVKKKTIILPIAIPYSSIAEKMGIYQSPVFEFGKSSKPALAYMDLWKTISRIRL